MVSFGSQGEVVTSRSKTVVVTIEVWKELLQDMMLVVLDSVEQTFVGIFSEFSSSGVTSAVGRTGRAEHLDGRMIRCAVCQQW